MKTCSDIKCKANMSLCDNFGDMVLSFNTIMSKIQASDNYDEIQLYCEYFNANKKRYTIAQLLFAIEFVDDKVSQITK